MLLANFLSGITGFLSSKGEPLGITYSKNNCMYSMRLLCNMKYIKYKAINTVPTIQ